MELRCAVADVRQVPDLRVRAPLVQRAGVGLILEGADACKMQRSLPIEKALEDSLGDWYEQAMLASGVSPVGDPSLDLNELPDEVT